MINIILIAPPAGGKGTQAAMIEQEYNIPHISTGDLLRSAIKANDIFSNSIKDCLDKGNLVSDEIVLELLKNRIKQDDCQKGYILDGFPRNLDQAKQYDRMLNLLNKEFSIVIIIDVDKDVAKSRTLGRLSCPKCGQVYNTQADEKKPLVNGICDKCKTELVKRDDDNSETYDIRYANYLEKTEPLIDYYQQKNILYHVDGNHSSDYTYQQINGILRKYLCRSNANEYIL